MARAAAQRRWSTLQVEDAQAPQRFATHRGEVPIADTRIPCAVLDDGTRVLTENGITNALLGSRSGASKRLKKAHSGDGALLPLFLAPSNLSPYITQDLIDGPLKPIAYRDGNRVVIGFEANALPTMCDVWLKARRDGALQEQQKDKAMKAEMLMSGLAYVAVVALIDEATGYQEVRDKQALQAILDAYLRKELAAWAKRFPDEFYEQMFRLRGWEWRGRKVNPPSVVGHYTNDLVYERLAPGIVEELEKLNPKTERGRRKSRHHQWLTDDVGHPALAQHIYALIGFMRASGNWEDFYHMVGLAFPKKNSQMLLI